MERAKSFISGGQELHVPTGLEALKRAASNLSINKLGKSMEDKSQTTPKLPSAKFKMKEATKFLLKLHVIKEKAEMLTHLLKDLKIATERCKDRYEDAEIQEDFVNQTLEVAAHVKLARKLTLFLCKHRALERHVIALKAIQEQMKPTLDISVQFFGLDWDNLFRVSIHFQKLTDELGDAFRDLSEENNEIDIFLPNSILRNLAIIEADIYSHAEAVLKGRLSQRHKDKITTEQKRFSVQANELTALNLQRIESELFENDGTKRRKSIWKNFKREIQHGILRKERKSSHDHDNLWKMWYNGVQSVAAPVAFTVDDKDPGSESDAIEMTAVPSEVSTEKPSLVRRMSSFKAKDLLKITRSHGNSNHNKDVEMADDPKDKVETNDTNEDANLPTQLP